ncbi:ABC transporter permease [Cellulosimicrobium marinum]|uniref:ABC transporter permease n=1 Tax=Cellulosimicrobium marinum TaxID=1638992 RepID=UPI001E6083E6|nr:hypothetical protein [Cellulosimicrobium marinum]MCB7136660.1 hypothetical protein [Cellulosimicrobium marinum]
MSGHGLGAVLRLQLRTGWVGLAAWTGGLVATYVATVAAIDATYGTPEQLATYGATVGADPTMAAINGTPYGADTLGGVVANEFGFVAALAVPLMGLTLVARSTRRAEEVGLLELVRSRAVSARAPWTAALLLGAGALVLVGAGAAVTLVSYGVDVGDAVLYGASLTGLGLVFAGVATLAGQLQRRASAVVGTGVVVLGAAYVLRALGDVRDNGWRWLSPLAWQQETRPFADDARVWPLLLALGVAAGLVAAGLVLVGRRDLGSAVVASRPGPVHAGALLRSTTGLAVQQHGPVLLAWAAGAALVGAVFGAFTGDVDDVVTANPDLQTLLAGATGGSDPASWYVSYCLVLTLLMATGAGAQVIGRARAEETRGRLEPVLARAVPRARWIATHAGVAVAGTVLVALAGGAGLALTAAADGDAAGTLAATATSLPAVLVVPSLGVALFGALPRFTAAVWGAFAYVALVELLGATLRLPGWALDLSPLHAVGRLPVEDASGVAVTLSGLLAVALVVLGIVGFRHRDIPR